MEKVMLDAIAGYLGAAGRLAPVPAGIGIIEPEQSAELPALVMSLNGLRRSRFGLGERSQIRTGALPWSATIDLAHPVLPGDPPLVLLSPDRLRLTLPHGGLVHADGSAGPLGPGDLQVTAAGAPRAVVSGTPTGDQVSADAARGTLLFASPLPAEGSLEAAYFIGQWEQRTRPLAGELTMTVRAALATEVADLGDSVIAVLEQAPAAIPGLRVLELAEAGVIATAGPELPASRSRTLVFRFEFEMTVDRPEPSGGVIGRVIADLRLQDPGGPPRTVETMDIRKAGGS